ncbi:MAG: hypothetical protein M3Q08_04715 [Pseudomonadota bacterium]|nr:hypothetical protein [Pseudomonadota bacterium]
MLRGHCSSKTGATSWPPEEQAHRASDLDTSASGAPTGAAMGVLGILSERGKRVPRPALAELAAIP